MNKQEWHSRFRDERLFGQIERYLFERRRYAPNAEAPLLVERFTMDERTPWIERLRVTCTVCQRYAQQDFNRQGIGQMDGTMRECLSFLRENGCTHTGEPMREGTE